MGIILSNRIRVFLTGLNNKAPDKVFGNGLGTLAKRFFCICLQRLSEIGIAFACDNCKGIDALDVLFAQSLQVLAFTIAIYAKSQTTADFLALASFGIRMLKSANLENVRVVPPLAQGGVTKDKTSWLFKGEQTLLILENQIVRVLIIRFITSTLELGIDRVSPSYRLRNSPYASRANQCRVARKCSGGGPHRALCIE